MIYNNATKKYGKRNVTCTLYKNLLLSHSLSMVHFGALSGGTELKQPSSFLSLRSGLYLIDSFLSETRLSNS